jgi:hypothetical protein
MLGMIRAANPERSEFEGKKFLVPEKVEQVHLFCTRKRSLCPIPRISACVGKHVCIGLVRQLNVFINEWDEGGILPGCDASEREEVVFRISERNLDNLSDKE